MSGLLDELRIDKVCQLSLSDDPSGITVLAETDLPIGQIA